MTGICLAYGVAMLVPTMEALAFTRLTSRPSLRSTRRPTHHSESLPRFVVLTFMRESHPHLSCSPRPHTILQAANALLPTYVTVCMYFGGLFLLFDKIPIYWQWFSWTSFLRYSWGAMMNNQFRHSKV